MRLSGILAFSVCLNIVLAAACFLLFRQPSLNQALDETRADAAAPVTNISPQRTVVTTKKIPFQWLQLESEDYAVYIENLRAIGCPEETIRDIIVAEIDALYANKRNDEVGSLDMEWWRSRPSREFENSIREISGDLINERDEVLQVLLGSGWEDADPRRFAVSETRFTGAILSGVPEETRDRIAEVNDRYAGLLSELRASGDVVDPKQVAKLRADARAELQALMSAEQFEEYLLRYSSSANTLRADLEGFEVTPAEFRELFRKRDRLEQQRDLQGLDAAEGTSFAQDLKSVYESTLSQERYQEYQLFQDPVYRHSVDVAQEMGLDSDAALSVYQVRQAAEQEHLAIQNDASLSEEERTSALAALRQERQDVLMEVLGEDNYRGFIALDAYRRFYGELQETERLDVAPGVGN